MAEIEYALGHSEREMRRLELQSAVNAAGTDRVLRAAGLAPGNSVLDVGTGVGDVSMLLAEMVGPSGSVLGIDREPSVLVRASERAAAAGHDHIRYQAATLDALPEGQTFDAVVGRYVLAHQTDRLTTLRQAAARVRPGGTLVFLEPDAPEPDLPDTTMHDRWSNPPAALFDEIRDLVQVAFRLGGSRLRTGGMLARLFHDAGLPEPKFLRDVPTGGPSSSIVELMYLIFESLLPVLEQHGVTTAKKIGLDTLQARMRADVFAARSQLKYYDLVGAWVQLR